jgi:GTP pyrophosphokinase/guanosine-3',5'-bis(diphosphate) 3'-pyrophosphohydrolase
MSGLVLKYDLDAIVLDAPQQMELDALLGICHEYLESCDDRLVEKAFKLCYKAHLGLVRSSGEPYYLHPLEVATIVIREFGIDDVSVCAALLHDTVEDTDVTLDDISREFGPEVRSLIDGLTKISGVFLNKGVKQAEAFMKLLLSMAEDLRVVMIKFADRLHNMRTIQHLPRNKQLSIATETMELFAPLAHRFGLFNIKSELEDLSFKVIDPNTFKFIARKLREKKEDRERFIDTFMEPIRQQLNAAGFNFEIKGRPKHIYSIYRKMMRQQKPFEEIYDLFAIRIILDEPHTKEDCWRVYSFITDAYTPIPERFRDFISVPKANGYQSLHTTVISRSGKVEVQIRTKKMDEIAEMGLAAHWKYKEGSSGSQTIDRFVHWVRDVLDNPRPEAITEFVQDFQLNLYTDEIYVFTPKGELVTLPRGSTPIDFAFEIHTQVGERALAAKVNAKLVPLRHKLQSGDQVEVITGNKINLNPDWMNDVVTHKAKSHIRQYIKQRERQVADEGRALFEKKLDKGKVEISEQDLMKVALKFKYTSLQKIYYDIATDVFSPVELYKSVKQFVSGKAEEERQKGPVAAEEEVQEIYFEEARSAVAHRKGLIINGDLTDIKYTYAQCCNPIPGDEVVGFVSRNGDVKIHRTNCNNALHLLQNDPDRMVNVSWAKLSEAQFLSAVKVIGEDRVGMISDITNAISKSLKTNMKSINVSSDSGMFEGILIVYVESTAHLERVIQRLQKVPGVKSVFRF